jgi:hypothetical protein
VSIGGEMKVFYPVAAKELVLAKIGEDRRWHRRLKRRPAVGQS